MDGYKIVYMNGFSGEKDSGIGTTQMIINNFGTDVINIKIFYVVLDVSVSNSFRNISLYC